MIGRLLCRLGRHAPVPDGLWNAGYCFTRCNRCECDMVRSAFGEWHVPKSHRVVWRPPADGRVAANVSAPAEAERRPTRLHRERPRDPFDFDDFEEHGEKAERLFGGARHRAHRASGDAR